MSGTISSLTDDLGTVIGSGSDAITLKVSEDPAGSGEGSDAQFTVNVDGEQIGGVQTATASHAAGQDDTFTFRGEFAPGDHKATVTFTNNNGTQGDKFSHGGNGDRNLYIDGVSYDGQTISSVTTPIYESPLFPPNSTDGVHPGNAVFTVNDTTPVNGTPGVADSPTPAPVDVGSGADTLTLNMSEDPYQGDAQFTVAVDGKQVGGTLTTTAIAWQGQLQAFNLHGDWGSGDHTVTVNYLSDHIGDVDASGAAYDNTDQNLFVMSGSYDGIDISGTPWELYSNGPHDFSVPAGGQPGNANTNGSSGGTSVSGTSGAGTDTGTTIAGSDSGSNNNSSSSSASTGGNTDTSPVATGSAGNADNTGTSGTATAGNGSDVAPVNTDTINGQTGNSSGGDSSSASGSGSSGSGSGMSFISDPNGNSSQGNGQSTASSGNGNTDNTQTTGSNGGNNWWDKLSSKDFQNAGWNNSGNDGSSWQDWLSSLKSQPQSQGWSHGSGDNSGAFTTGGSHWPGFQTNAG